MATYTKSAMQRLAETSKDFEIWWDSSPLIFKAWTKSMLDKAPQDKKGELEKQLKVLFDYDRPEDTLFCGVTTNPPFICLHKYGVFRFNEGNRGACPGKNEEIKVFLRSVI